MGIDTVGSAAVGDNLGARGECWRDAVKIGKRHIPRTRDVTHRKFIRRPHIKYGNGALRDACSQFVAGDGLDSIGAIAQAAQNALDLCKIALRHHTDQVHQLERPCIAQPVDHGLSLTVTGDQAGAAQRLQMLRGISDGEAGLVVQCLSPSVQSRFVNRATPSP